MTHKVQARRVRAIREVGRPGPISCVAYKKDNNANEGGTFDFRAGSDMFVCQAAHLLPWLRAFSDQVAAGVLVHGRRVLVSEQRR